MSVTVHYTMKNPMDHVIDDRKIIAAFKAGASMAEVADAFHVDLATVEAVIRRARFWWEPKRRGDGG